MFDLLLHPQLIHLLLQLFFVWILGNNNVVIVLYKDESVIFSKLHCNSKIIFHWSLYDHFTEHDDFYFVVFVLFILTM